MKERNTREVSGRTAFSAAWLVTSRLMTKGVDFVLLLVLARLLTPADFGLVAIGMTLIFIVEAVLELPIIQVLVRIEHLEDWHFDTAFTLGVIRGTVLALLLTILAWPFARFYGDPRLFPLIMLLSMAPAARGLLSPRLAIFARQLDYRRDFLIEVSGKVVAFVVATSLALATRSYWSIALGTVSTCVTMMMASYLLAPYRPRLSLRDWRLFASFLGWTSAAQLITAINWQCDRLLLGRFVSRPALGLFSMANDLSYLPEQALIKPILRPLMAAFSLLTHDLERLRSAYERTAASVLAIGMPIMLGLSVLAEPAVRFALGDKWAAAAPILQLLSLTLLPPLFASPLGALAMALGRTSIFLRQSLIELAVKLPIIALGAMFGGVQGVVTARLCSATIMAIVSLLFVRQLIGTPLLRQVLGAWRVLASGGVLAVILLLLRPLLAGLHGPGLGLSIVAAAVVAMICYCTTLFLLWQLAGRPAGLETLALRSLEALRGTIVRRPTRLYEADGH